MAKPSKQQAPSEDVSNSSSEEEQVNEQTGEVAEDEEDKEGLEAVARSANGSDEEEADGYGVDNQDEEDEQDGSDACNNEVAKREKARLKEMQRLEKQKIQEILDEQNAAIDADMNKRGKGRLKYLLQQTEIFAHFAKGDRSASQKKA